MSTTGQGRPAQSVSLGPGETPTGLTRLLLADAWVSGAAAERQTMWRCCRPQGRKLNQNRRLLAFVVAGLAQRWSPAHRQDGMGSGIGLRAALVVVTERR